VEFVEPFSLARVVHEDVGKQVFGPEAVHVCRDRPGVSHVEGRGVHLNTVVVGQVGAEFLHPFNATRGEEEMGTLGGEGARARLSDSSGCTRN
jgi:hypothetical protein